MLANASLKDMRDRIASTKATQKITKAMQMVAASKLRRAQAAAEAARPYAKHMDKVLGNIAASVVAARPRRGCCAAPAATACICCWSAPAERGLCGPFNSAIVRLARERANALMAEGKEVKSSASAARATTSSDGTIEQADHRDWSSCARCADRVSSTPR